MEKKIPKIGLYLCDTGGKIAAAIDLPAAG